jgi:flagellar biosynthesis protein FlhG
VLVDLDLGGANLHTCFGQTDGTLTLSAFIESKQQHINEFVQPIPATNLGLISGAAGSLEIANMKHFQKQKILRNLGHIDADYVILDLGAGTSFNTLDFFARADHGIVTVVPDPTSVENTYRFLKCAMIRRLRQAPEASRKLMMQVLGGREGEARSVRTLATLMDAMQQRYPEHAGPLRDALARQQLHLIVNQVLEPADTDLGSSIAMVCSKYFGQKIHYLGHLHHDRQVLAAMRLRRPFLMEYPQSRAAIYLENMAAELIDGEKQDEA